MHAVVLLALLKLTLRLELGPEYDSNANRSEVVRGAVNTDPPVQSALVRTTARFGLAYKNGRNLLKAQVGFGSKVFFNPGVFDQDVVVGQAALEDHVTLDRHSELTILGDYYDAFQGLAATTCVSCIRRRDFRTGQGALRLSAYDGPGTFWIGGAYRGFQYKPDSYFNFQSPTGEIGASIGEQLGSDEAPHDLTFAASYRIERRQYGHPKQELNSKDPTINCRPDAPLVDGCLVYGSTNRLDYFHEAGFELSYVGVLLASIGYTLQLDQSNSFGQSLIRHVVTLKVAYRLPWQLYATAKLQLLVSDGLDRVVLDPQVSNLTFATIEDENRNAVIVDLERDIPLKIARHNLSVDARYSFFASTLGAQQTSFRRHVAYVGLTYRFGTR